MFNGTDLPKLNAKIPMTTGLGKVVSHFISQKEADVSLMPTIAVPLLRSEEEEYKVRTLLDSGSMTNWIAKEVLENLCHTVKGHTTLEVVTLTGSVHRKFKLVEVLYKFGGTKYNINCYVIDDFAQHMAVKGIVKYIIENSSIP